MKRSSFPYVLLATVAVLLLFSCASAQSTPPAAPKETSREGVAAPKPGGQEKWDQLVSAAKKEGRVVLYGEIGPELRAAISEAFQKKFGIEMDVVSAKTGEIAQRFLKEDQANVAIADALMTGQTTTLVDVKPKGVLAPIPPLVVLPEVTDPKVWKEGRVPYLDADKTAVALIASYRTFLVLNTEMVSDNEIQSYQDILDPKWKGKIIMRDPTLGGSSATWVSFMSTKVLGMEEGAKFLRRFAQQEPVITRDDRILVESVAKKKYPLGLGPSSQLVPEFQKVGAPVQWAKVKEGGIVVAGAAVISVPQRPAHPNASAVLVNWLLTKEGQTAFVKGYGQPSRRADVSSEGMDPSLFVPQGEKMNSVDEEQIYQEGKLMAFSKEVFGPLMK